MISSWNRRLQRRFFFFFAVFFVSLLGAAASPILSTLAPPPDWKQLEPYQRTITRLQLTRWINETYSPDGGFWKYTQLNDHELILFSDLLHTVPLFRLELAPERPDCRPAPHLFAPIRSHESTPSLPLRGIKICLDPGHVGGEWAKMEERFFQLGSDPSVEEASLNLWTCEHLAQLLQQAGAEVSWAKHELKPVTPLRPADCRDAAFLSLFVSGDFLQILTPDQIELRMQKQAEAVFYRTAEIQARAAVVAQAAPDLTVCLHYNAAPWGAPSKPSMVPQSKLVVFVTGAFSERELIYDDQKFNLMKKMLDQTAPLELGAAEAIAKSMRGSWSFLPEKYVGWNAVFKVGTEPMVYARNLLANRLYPGPVVFVEGPYMNAMDAYPRLIAGDYPGVRLIAGKNQISIFQEYATIVFKGLMDYFAHFKGESR